jgi:hypothetical protein
MVYFGEDGNTSAVCTVGLHPGRTKGNKALLTAREISDCSGENQYLRQIDLLDYSP